MKTEEKEKKKGSNENERLKKNGNGFKMSERVTDPFPLG